MFFVVMAVLVIGIPLMGLICGLAQFMHNVVQQQRIALATAKPIPAEISKIQPKRIKKKERVVSIPSPVKTHLNTNSNIKEYRLPDGSKVAFDANEVEFSERSAI